MGLINVLDINTANLIAAGEVVERPASAVKELLENSGDAGATKITVEIKAGGTTFLRICDDGCGMSREDLKNCILRHATSKIQTADDLNSISTMGFRGEALAAISAISETKIISKRKEDKMGSVLISSYGDILSVEEAGCPNGTTIVCENMFKNVPARRKFLKKDFTESSAVVATCEKFALSRTDISMCVICDGSIKLQTPGDGNLKNAIYSILGKDFAKSILPVDYSYSGLRTYGYIARPELSRGNRNMQNFFVNKRYVRSRTIMAALEEGFHSFCPIGKFPACVLFLELDCSATDVNIHPAKLEIKFFDERKVFDCVYFGVKNALSKGLLNSELENVFTDTNQKPNENNLYKYTEKETLEIDIPKTVENNFIQKAKIDTSTAILNNFVKSESIGIFGEKLDLENEPLVPKLQTNFVLKSPIEPLKSRYDALDIPYLDQLQTTPQPVFSENDKILPDGDIIPIVEELKNEIRYIGEVFDAYLIVVKDNVLYLVDKHAAHERILYESLKSNSVTSGAQFFLNPLTINLTSKEISILNDNKEYFAKTGFVFDEFGVNTIILRSCPLGIDSKEAENIFLELAEKCDNSNLKAAGEIFDRALYSAACKAALKAGEKNNEYDNKWIIDKLFSDDAILYCPHGRPVLIEFSRAKLDKMFKRT